MALAALWTFLWELLAPTPPCAVFPVGLPRLSAAVLLARLLRRVVGGCCRRPSTGAAAAVTFRSVGLADVLESAPLPVLASNAAAEVLLETARVSEDTEAASATEVAAMATGLHAALFPSMLHLVSLPVFPFNVIGSVHVSSHITVRDEAALRRVIARREHVTVTTSWGGAGCVRPHRRGGLCPLGTVVTVGGGSEAVEVWKAVNTMLFADAVAATATGSETTAGSPSGVDEAQLPLMMTAEDADAACKAERDSDGSGGVGVALTATLAQAWCAVTGEYQALRAAAKPTLQPPHAHSLAFVALCAGELAVVCARVCLRLGVSVCVVVGRGGGGKPLARPCEMPTTQCVQPAPRPLLDPPRRRLQPHSRQPSGSVRVGLPWWHHRPRRLPRTPLAAGRRPHALAGRATGAHQVRSTHRRGRHSHAASAVTPAPTWPAGRLAPGSGDHNGCTWWQGLACERVVCATVVSAVCVHAGRAGALSATWQYQERGGWR